MLRLYDYQQECVDRLFEYLKVTKGKDNSNPLIQIPTGAGKSLIQAHVIKKILQLKPNASIICLCHMTEIIKQNFTEFVNYTDASVAGIYCGKLRRKDNKQVLFSSIQSVYKSRLKCNWFDFVFIDEAHLCSNKSQGTYRTFIDSLLRINPRLRVIGMTATPWRMDNGCLMSGDQKLFNAKVYQITLKELIKKKMLLPIVTPKDKALYAPNLDDLVMSQSTKDFTLDSQQSAMMRAVDPIMEEALPLLEDRKKILIFCPTIIVCEKVLAILLAKGEIAELFLGTTGENDRLRIKTHFENHKIRFLVSVNALTTGFNVKSVDGIICLRATASSSLWIQILGRGMRTYASKLNCLLLDYGDNINRHGPVELIESPPAKQKASGSKMAGEYVFIKKCPNCDQEIAMNLKTCNLCNYEYPVIERKFHPLTAGKDALFVGSNDTDKMFIIGVNTAFISHHIKEDTKAESIRIEFFCKNGKSFNKFLKFDNTAGGLLKKQADEFLQHMIFCDGQISEDIEFYDRVKLITELTDVINKVDYAGFMKIMNRVVKEPTEEEIEAWHLDNPMYGQSGNGDDQAIEDLSTKLCNYIAPQKIKVDMEGKFPQVIDMIYDKKPEKEHVSQ